MEFLIFFGSVSLFTLFLLFTYCEDFFNFTLFERLRIALDNKIITFINFSFSFFFRHSEFVRKYCSKTYISHKTKKDAIEDYVNYLKTGQKKSTNSIGTPSKHLTYIKKDNF